LFLGSRFDVHDIDVAVEFAPRFERDELAIWGPGNLGLVVVRVRTIGVDATWLALERMLDVNPVEVHESKITGCVRERDMPN
jgi:hypothetical protein